MHDVRTQWDSQNDTIAESVKNPLGALGGSLAGGVLGAQAMHHVDAYAHKNCGSQLFGTAPRQLTVAAEVGAGNLCDSPP